MKKGKRGVWHPGEGVGEIYIFGEVDNSVIRKKGGKSVQRGRFMRP